MFALSGCTIGERATEVALLNNNFSSNNQLIDRAAALITDTAAVRSEEEMEEESSQPILKISDEELFINLYERVNPAVVNIQAKSVPTPISYDGQSVPNQLPPILEFPRMPGFPYDDFWANPEMPMTPALPRQSQGSGFVYDEMGHIVTNNHVVDEADEIVVIFADGAEFEAVQVGADPDSDLAVLKIDGAPEGFLQPVPIASSSEFKVGQMVIAIGNPYGLSGSMSKGIISGLGRILPAEASQFSIPNIIQTDAAINPGNSGGPLLNLDGEVIGVNTAIASPNRSFAGIGYAVPANTVLDVVPQLIKSGEVEHPWLGIAGRTLARADAEAMELDADQRGVLITDVMVNSPAYESELRGSDQQLTVDGQPIRIGGDIITGVDGVEINQFDDLLSYVVGETEVGETISLQILRNGNEIELELTLSARPDEEKVG